MSEVMMDRISWVEYQQRIEKSDPVVFLPCGSLEQHGPHLPLGVDAMLSTAVSRVELRLQVPAPLRRRPAFSRHHQP